MWAALFHVKYLFYFQEWNLGHKFSQVIHRFKFGIFVLVLGYTFKFFPITESFRHATYLKRDTTTGVNLWIVNFAKFLWTPFLIKHLLLAASTTTKVSGFLNYWSDMYFRRLIVVWTLFTIDHFIKTKSNFI